MEQLYIFAIAFIASFIGSIQLGPVNLTILQTSVNKNFTAAFYAAVGGCLPEIIYAAIAVAGTSLIAPDGWFMKYAGFIMVPLLLGLGIHKIRSKSTTEETKLDLPDSKVGDFSKGFMLSILNPLLLPYWSSVLIYNTSLNVISLDNPIDKTLFVFGAAAGALGLLMLFAWFGHWKKEKINKLVNGNINKSIGYIFIALAGIQLVVLILRLRHLI
ncbi:LysE family translocator [Solitalea koreensis]|uniref:Threonine/homoserine/homoserine lactone efflux protein n=1 Tax=Solitalea koreensis TaxID=543615 RepID=A0A521E0P6_9SPHI|nr:LysE family transporter [Solitalea koreensis]SMO77543.1 Threonine/homoserine/homoserine lactone efflux protein [Solitalea koreensis]